MERAPRSAGSRLGLAVLGCCLLLGASLPGVAAAGRPGGLAYALVDIDEIGHHALTRLERSPAFEWWIEADDRLLVLADMDDLELLGGRWSVEVLDVPVEPDRLAFVDGARFDVAEKLGGGVDVLVRAGRLAVVQSRSGFPELPTHDTAGRHAHSRLLPFEPGTVLVRQWANRRAAGGDLPESDSLVEAVVSQVDMDRWFDDVAVLSGFDRYTHGTEIDLARDWLVVQFDQIQGLDVEVQSYTAAGTTIHNVIATWTGTHRPDDWYVVGAHYDSISENPYVSAPGAEDNASGCAGVLEMARVLTEQQPPNTVVFICYSGEEQGLWGSLVHIEELEASGDLDKVKAMLNMDMIGYNGDADMDCMVETGPAFEQYLDLFGQAAQEYTNLRIVTSLNPHTSDHLPYLHEGIPAILTIENDFDIYPDYHRSTDGSENVSVEMGSQILRMNAAVLAQLTGIADGGPIFLDGFESGDLSAWSSSVQ